MTNSSDTTTRQVGQYHLKHKIGEGGMGVVWAATQEHPSRKVAVKLLKPRHLDSQEVLGRFMKESESLARLNHPNIATIFDAGVASDGRPYFVMEFIEGVPLTAFCDQQKLTLADRLKIFLAICQAVQHAHQHGIVHRDLKPSNIMVALRDGVPTPVIIDFGIAKAVDSAAVAKQIFTEEGVLLGTVPYISPEQAEGRPVDGRTDVYSLGVIFYELLTGTLPLTWERLRSAGYRKMVQMICTEEPPKPSLRLSKLGRTAVAKVPGAGERQGQSSASSSSRASADTEVHGHSTNRDSGAARTDLWEGGSAADLGTQETLDQIASKRHSTPKDLLDNLRGDLDVIVLHALDKSPTHRYASPGELADDIVRYLEHRPIIARPPSVTYKAQKYLRRHRAGVAVATLVLAVGIVTLMWWRTGRVAERGKHALADSQNRETARRAGHAQDKRAEGSPQPDEEAEIESNLRNQLRENPDDWKALYNLAQHLSDQFKVTQRRALADEGLRLVNRALEIDRRADAYNLNGILLRGLGQIEDSYTAFQTGISIDDGYFPTYVSFANTLVLTGEFDKARELLRTACKKLPSDRHVQTNPWHRFYNLAAVELSFQDPGAVAAIKSALDQQGRNVQRVQLLRAKCHLLLPSDSDVEKARKHLILAGGRSGEESTDPQWHRLSALAELRAENWSQAYTVALRAIELGDPLPTYPRLIAAAAMVRLGKVEEARALREQAIQSWPEQLKSGERLGVVEGGFLWFDTKAELDDLLARVDEALASANPSPDRRASDSP